MAARLYIALRSDLLGMSPGRAAAQASHGTSTFHEKFNSLPETSLTYSLKRAVNEWKEEAEGFGTAIVLKATYGEILDLQDQAVLARAENSDTSKDNFYFRRIIDPQYFYKGPGELFEAKDVLTGAVVFIPDESREVEEVGRLFEKIYALPLF